MSDALLMSTASNNLLRMSLSLAAEERDEARRELKARDALLRRIHDAWDLALLGDPRPMDVLLGRVKPAKREG